MYVSNLKVLWISKRDGNGICIDNSGNECYIDSSIQGFEQLVPKDNVGGSIDRVGGVLCVRTLNHKYNSEIVIKHD